MRETETMDNKRARVLMLENDRGIHAALIAFAKGAGFFDLEIVSTTSQLLSLASVKCFDAFVLDVRLDEGETGVGAALRLRSKCPNTPVAFYTSWDMPSVKDAAFEIGAQVWNKTQIPESDLPTMIIGLIKGGPGVR